MRFQRRLFFIVETTALSFLCVCFLSSCGPQKPAAVAEGSRQFTDESGRTITLPARVDRVVSLAPNLTEIVFALGAGDRLVGNTTFCDYPAAAKQVSKVGDTLHPSIERIIALRPQLVLVSTASQLEVFTKQLADQQIAVYVTDPHDLAGVFRSIENVASLLNLPENAPEVVGSLRNRTASVEEALKSAKPVKVFYQLSAEPLYTAGRDAFVTDIIRLAGGQSVTADVPGGWPKFSAESALAANPDAIILPTGGSMGAANSTVARALADSPAVRNGRIYRIDGDHLTRPGPRAVDGLEEIARALHPESFRNE